MEKYSAKEILARYFDQKIPIEITLTDNTVLTGKLISFYHENEDDQEAITAWHFLNEEEIEKYDEFVSINGGAEYGTTIKQADIKSIKFK